jgi:hypothetical protein
MRFFNETVNYQRLLWMICTSRTSLISSLPYEVKILILQKVKRMEKEFLANLQSLIGRVLHLRQFNISRKVYIIEEITFIVTPSWTSPTFENRCGFCIEDKVMTPRELLAVCANCKCCERHQIGRPGVSQFALSKWWLRKSRSEGGPMFDYDLRPGGPCWCPCRHLARFWADGRRNMFP